VLLAFDECDALSLIDEGSALSVSQGLPSALFALVLRGRGGRSHLGGDVQFDTAADTPQRLRLPWSGKRASTQRGLSNIVGLRTTNRETVSDLEMVAQQIARLHHDR
jgi:hypothetical protein